MFIKRPTFGEDLSFWNSGSLNWARLKKRGKYYFDSFKLWFLILVTLFL